MLELNQLYLMDCMDGMKQIPDKYFELAIVDPPYGIGAAKMNLGNGKKSYVVGKDWDDNIPSESYFNELFRVSVHQIIWGGDYFDLPPTRCILAWDKLHAEGVDFADFEIAWTSFDRVAKRFGMRPMGMDGGKIHPTQKPTALYKWILTNYAKPGDKILDTHVGSASSLIACYDLGFEYMGFELDEDYYAAAQKRIADNKAQMRMAL